MTTHASNTEAQASTGEPLYWFNNDGSVYQSSGLVDKDTRLMTTGCSGTQVICEKGYSDEQLNVSGQPQNGVDPAFINSQIQTIPRDAQ